MRLATGWGNTGWRRAWSGTTQASVLSGMPSPVMSRGGPSRIGMIDLRVATPSQYACPESQLTHLPQPLAITPLSQALQEITDGLHVGDAGFGLG